MAKTWNRVTITPEIAKVIRDGLDAGHPREQIAENVGIAQGTLNTYIQGLAVEPPDPAQVAELVENGARPWVTELSEPARKLIASNAKKAVAALAVELRKGREMFKKNKVPLYKKGDLKW